MVGDQGAIVLGVDLGTSNVVAVLRWPDGRTRALLVAGLPIMPSGAYLDEAGRLHVGRDAARLAQLDPARFEPNPKRRVDEVAVLLADREVPVVDLFAAVLGAVGRAAVEAVGFLPPTVLTHPAAWGPRRREQLAVAAARAGWRVGGAASVAPHVFSSCVQALFICFSNVWATSQPTWETRRLATCSRACSSTACAPTQSAAAMRLSPRRSRMSSSNKSKSSGRIRLAKRLIPSAPPSKASGGIPRKRRKSASMSRESASPEAFRAFTSASA